MNNSTKVYIDDRQKKMKVPSGTRLLVRRACKATLKFENFPYPAEISVSFVDDEEIYYSGAGCADGGPDGARHGCA